MFSLLILATEKKEDKFSFELVYKNKSGKEETYVIYSPEKSVRDKWLDEIKQIRSKVLELEARRSLKPEAFETKKTRWEISYPILKKFQL